MANYTDDDELDDYDDIEQPTNDEAEPQPAGNRNFLLALGILGGIFLLLVIALIAVTLLRPRTTAGVPERELTNAAVLTLNAATAGAATEAAIILLTPTVTPTYTVTPTFTVTPVVAEPTFTETPDGMGGGQDNGVATVTPEGFEVDPRTATVAVLLTQRAHTQIVQTQQAGGIATNTPIGGELTATRLPDTGFAEDVGLPGLFGMALGLVVLIVLARRLRLSTSG